MLKIYFNTYYLENSWVVGGDLRLWSLNVIALIHSVNEKMMEFGGSVFGRYFDEYTPKYG